MSDKSGSDTVIQKDVSEPWAAIQPNLTQIASEAQRLYQGGIGPSYYPGATYVGPTTQEMSGLQGMQNLAAGGNPFLPGLLNTAQSQITGGGLSAEQRGGLDPLKRIASGQDSISVTQPGQNTEFMNVLDTAAARTKGLMDTGYGGIGRSGGAVPGVISREIGDLYSRGLAGQYNTDVQNRMQAESANLANRAGATGQLQGIYGQGANNALAWGAMAPDIRNQQFGDSQRLIDVGAAQRGELQAELQSNIDRYMAQQQRPWDMLNLYNQTVSGVAPYGGSQTAYGQQGSPIAGLLGGAATGAGIGGQIGGAPGGLLGAGVGSLAGLLI
jgi:hypothetical protein